MTKQTLLALAVLAIAPLGVRADLLDAQLGPTAPQPAEIKPAPAPAPAAADNIVSPDAVRKVDDADLTNKFINPDPPKDQGNQVKEKMTDMLARMDQSQKRLTEKDPGEVTQETQRRIITDLDVLIDVARQQCNKAPDPNAEQQKQEKQYSQGKSGSGQQSQGGSTAAQQSNLPRGASATPAPIDDIRAKGGEEWGRLPAKDRDLVSHGANEEYLSSYKDMIDRYYQALAELGKTRVR